MATVRKSIHGEWSSRWTFVLAATGSAVGLGNIWRFPYITGENGGGAFVLIYLVCVVVIGVPVMMSEVMLGRRGRQSPINTMRTLAADEGKTALWSGVGWLGMAAGFFILSFYSVVAGWTIAYVFRTGFNHFDGVSAQASADMFDALMASPESLLAWHTIFTAITILVVSQGVRGGLERAAEWLMPALFILLLVMIGYAMARGNFTEAVTYLFKPDFSKVSAEVVLMAMGQAFFSLSLGMGAIMIYGSYLPQDASIPHTSFTIAASDTLVAILAGLAIFPIIFAYGLQAEGGPGLIFKALPVAFGQMPGGQFFGALFFLLLMVAALTSAISLLEPIVAWLVENRGSSRFSAAWLAGGGVWLLGVAALLSLNEWSGFTVFGKTIFDLLDFLTANIMLPLGGLLIAIFAGWHLSRASSTDELAMGSGVAYRTWRFLIRYVTPVGVGIIFLNALGIV